MGNINVQKGQQITTRGQLVGLKVLLIGSLGCWYLRSTLYLGPD